MLNKLLRGLLVQFLAASTSIQRHEQRQKAASGLHEGFGKSNANVLMTSTRVLKKEVL